MDLTQAEAVRDLIDAQTLTQVRQAASQMGGALSRRVAPVKQSLVELVALLEAGIDFAEDDVDVTGEQEIARRIDELKQPLVALEASFARGRIVHDGLTLAIVGRPNAGKSSLFNRLVERDRAIVTATPGTTRDLVTERISLDGIPLELVDTAGLREGLEEAEQLGIARSREALADAAVVLIVLDATQPLNEEEHRLLEAVEGRPAIVAINKSDLPAADSVPHETAGVPAVRTSALTGEGIPALREAHSGTGHRRRRGGTRNADQHPASSGNHNCAVGTERCRRSERRWNSPRDDPAGSLPRALGARLAHRPNHLRRHSQSDLLHLLHRKIGIRYVLLITYMELADRKTLVRFPLLIPTLSHQSIANERFGFLATVEREDQFSDKPT